MALEIISLLIIMVSQLLELNLATVDPVTPKLLPKNDKIQCKSQYVKNNIVTSNYLLEDLLVHSKV